MDCEWLASFDIEDRVGELHLCAGNSHGGSSSEDSEELHFDNVF